MMSSAMRHPEIGDNGMKVIYSLSSKERTMQAEGTKSQGMK